MASNDTIVLIPTYNEKENVAKIIGAVLSHADTHILIIDDGSPDGTGAIADDIAAREPRVKVMHRAKKGGLGPAYIGGMRYALEAGYEKICQMDADLSHPPERLPAMLEAARNADLVIGSRYVKKGGTRNWPLRRRLVSRGGSLYARTILGVGVRDMTAGYKVFDRKLLLAMGGLHDIRSTGYAFNIEMTYRAIQMGFRVVELPIVFVERAEGYSKMSAKIFKEAVRICVTLRIQVRPSAKLH